MRGFYAPAHLLMPKKGCTLSLIKQGARCRAPRVRAYGGSGVVAPRGPFGTIGTSTGLDPIPSRRVGFSLRSRSIAPSGVVLAWVHCRARQAGRARVRGSGGARGARSCAHHQRRRTTTTSDKLDKRGSTCCGAEAGRRRLHRLAVKPWAVKPPYTVARGIGAWAFVPLHACSCRRRRL